MEENPYEPDRALRCNVVRRRGDVFDLCTRTAGHGGMHMHLSYTGIATCTWDNDGEESTIARITRERDEAESAARVLGKELDEALAEVARARATADRVAVQARDAERARVVEWLRWRGSVAWPAAIEAGEHDK